MDDIKPVAWMCTRETTKDGRVFDGPFVATNRAYVEAHPLHDWTPIYPHSAIDTLTAEMDAARAECERLRTLCRDMLPVFEAARPLVLNLERLRDATKGEG